MAKKKEKKVFNSYREQLIDLAKLYGVVEIKSYYHSNKRLTVSQLELILIKNRIKLPANRSNARVIEQQEIREKSITNIYLSFCFIIFLGCLIVTRPYIKSIVHEVKFTYLATEFKEKEKTKIIENKKQKLAKKPENSIKEKKDKKLEADDAISLNAETTIILFEELEYNLEDIRNGQRVKPVYFTKLPRDIKTLGDTKKKKELFIKIVLPLILNENQKIIDDRKKLFKIINKKYNSLGEKTWLKRKFKQYRIENSDLSELKSRMDIIPASIAIAQAAKESGWGTSRFALQGNALFGQWTYGDKGIEPLEKDNTKNHKILGFQILSASVKAYKNNLNTHKVYGQFREERAKLRQKKHKIIGPDLTKYLEKYAETGEKYIKTIELIIAQNSLTDFDDSTLLSVRSKTEISL